MSWVKKKIKKFWKWIVGFFVATTIVIPFILPEPLGEVSFQPREREDIKTWNVLSSVQIEPNKTVTDFRMKYVRYYDNSDKWSLINTDFLQTPQGFVMETAPFKAIVPLTSLGTATMENNNRWDIFNKRKITESSLFMSLKAEGVNNVSGRIIRGDLLTRAGLQKNINYVLYEGAYPEGDLIYYVNFGVSPTLQKLVKINSAPTKLQYPFEISYSDAVDFSQIVGGIKKKWNKTDKFIFDKNKGIEVKKISGERGIAFKKFKIWDSAPKKLQKIQAVDIDIIPMGINIFRLTKDVASFFNTPSVYPVYTDTESTFYPDPNVETTSVDGTAARIPAQEAFADLRGGNGTASEDSQTVTDGIYISAGATTDLYDYMSRMFFFFDSSAIPDGDTVDSAIYSVITDTSGDSGLGGNVRLVDGILASNTAVANADYQGSVTGTTLQSDGNPTYASLDAASAFRDWTLNATGNSNVSKTSITKFALRSEFDRANSAPTWSSAASSLINATLADTAGTGSDPKLVVQHSEATAVSEPDATQGFFQILFNNLIKYAYAK